MKSKNILKSLNLLLLIFLLGLILRLAFPLDRGFGFDQNQIAQFSTTILKGDFTLIGPKTGPAQFFTGPLIYYLGALVYFIFNLHPIANTVLGVLIFMISFVVLNFFLNRLCGKKFKTLYLLFYSLSPYLICLDRTTWNPNISFLSASLVLFSLIFFNTKNKWIFLAGFLGMFLGYQAHFSTVVMFVPAALICLFVYRSSKLFISFLSGLLVSLLPLIYFDFRNNWLNLSGIKSLITNPDLVNQISYFIRLVNNSIITIESAGKIFLQFQAIYLYLLLGVCLFFYYFYRQKDIRNNRLIIGLWIIIYVIILSFYRGPKPEYYFIPQLPAFLYMLSVQTKNFFFQRQNLFGLILVLAVVSSGVVHQSRILDYSVKNKLLAVNYIKNHQQGPVNLIYDLDLSERFGWEYLLKYHNIPLDSQSPYKVHLIYPTTNNTITSAKYGKIGVWIDKRGLSQQENFYDEVNGVLFYYPPGASIIIHQERRLFSAYSDHVKAMKIAYSEDDEKSFFYLSASKDILKKLIILSEKELDTNFGREWKSIVINHPELISRKSYCTLTSLNNYAIFSFPALYSEEEIKIFLEQIEMS